MSTEAHSLHSRLTSGNGEFASGTNTPNGHTHGDSSLHLRAAPHSSAAHEAAPPIPDIAYTVGMPPEAALEGLSRLSKTCVSNFAAFKPAPERDMGVARQGAVLIALFQRPGEDGLRVILTTRAKHLRRNPSQTALPGGKRDDTDSSVIFTARREAYEEVGLPMDDPAIFNLAVLDPIVTIMPVNANLSNHIIVTPVVAFISDPSIVERLVPNPDEVDCLFDHPLAAIHAGHVHDEEVANGLVEDGSEWWPHPEQFYSQEDREGSMGSYRMHRFRTSASPIKGFTSNVMVSAVTIGYGEEPHYGHFAPDQQPFHQTIDHIVSNLPAELAEKAEKAKNGVKDDKPVEWKRSVAPGVYVDSWQTETPKTEEL